MSTRSIVISQFDDEDILSPPDPQKEYRHNSYYKTSGFTLLMKLCLLASEHLELYYKIKELLISSSININEQTTNGYTALYIACGGSTIEIIKLLLSDPNIDINLKNNNKNTVIECVCINNDIEKVKLLLSHPNIDINLKNNNGNTVLNIACIHGDIEIIKLLLSHPNIDINIKDNDVTILLFKK